MTRLMRSAAEPSRFTPANQHGVPRLRAADNVGEKVGGADARHRLQTGEPSECVEGGIDHESKRSRPPVGLGVGIVGMRRVGEAYRQ